MRAKEIKANWMEEFVLHFGFASQVADRGV
jgi:hypothetical protein